MDKHTPLNQLRHYCEDEYKLTYLIKNCESIIQSLDDEKDPMITYYMTKSNIELGYYHERLRTLTIHDKPREWSQLFLDKAILIWSK